MLSIFAFCCQNQDSRLIYCNIAWQTWQYVDTYKVSQIWTQIYRNQKILNNQDFSVKIWNFKNTKYNNHALNLGCFFRGCLFGVHCLEVKKGGLCTIRNKCNMGVTKITPMLHPFYKLCPSPSSLFVHPKWLILFLPHHTIDQCLNAFNYTRLIM
jgi:hypothetical protein